MKITIEINEKEIDEMFDNSQVDENEKYDTVEKKWLREEPHIII